MRSRTSLISFLLLLLAAPLAWSETTITENIFLIKRDGVSYLNYHSTRSSHPEYSLYLKKEENLDKYLYINPETYVYDKDSDPERNILTFKPGSYATMREGDFKAKVTVDENGVYTYTNYKEDRDGKPSNGHFGEWTTPDPFTTYVSAWVFPDNIEILDHKSNQEPDNWRRLTSNTLRWQGNDVNDIVFTIKYKFKDSVPALPQPLPVTDLGDLAKAEDVTVTQEETGVRLTLDNNSLFEEEGSELSEAGREMLAKVVTFLENNEGNRLIVEGHTDNQPITGPLLERFGTNWQLSSSRSLAVVQFLQEAGIPGSNMESRAYGEYKPVAENTTEEGRTKNRRTEIIIRPMS